ncbi:DNA-directed RNA polymerases I, II and III [Guillardia theta]|uniref:DNA-directed RNA polymerases I, II and III n=1 Tax=Guillardia theta TaxID=55529 RepID=Q9XG44_GUITH|nr:DNA-directed RNA polymerases I, II and III [Guillardia theta]CAB40410.1 DNA-directed RNA polymerases I, II and III [Guillardia theta]
MLQGERLENKNLLGTTFASSNLAVCEMEYICSECGMLINISDLTSLTCKSCGCRILYKKRSDEVVEYIARKRF